ncbi:MAG: PAS domain S-box protein [Ignavibacteriales bacterium]
MNLRVKSLLITGIAAALLAAALHLQGLASATTFVVVLVLAAVINLILGKMVLPPLARLVEGIRREARFRSITENVLDLIAQLTPEGAWQYASPSHKTVLGYDTGWLLGKSILDFVHPDDRPLIAAITEDPANSPVGPRVEARVRHAGGHYLCLECEGNPLLDARGVRSTILVGRDITEHKRADEELSHRLALEQAVTHVATSLMAEKVPDPGRMLGVLGQVLGADRAWVFLAREGGGCLDLMHWWPEPGTGEGPGPLTLYSTAIGWLWNALRNNESVVIPHLAALPAEASSEREIMQAQGVCSAVAIPLSCAGETLGLMGFGDVEEARDWPEEDVRLLRAVCEMMAGHIKRRRSEEALRESEERYRFLIENQDEGIAMLDLNEGFTFANPAAIEMFGSPPGGLVGRNLSEFTDPDNFNIILNNTKMRWQGLKTTYEIEIEASDGRKRILLLTGSPRFDSQNRLTGTFGIFRDITEQKQAEAEIRYLSFHDKLTGLYNRAYFEEELRRINGQRQMPISIIMGDVNGLKLVNDAFGHHEGDRILVEIAHVLKASCRKEDVVARWGGDEFVMVLPRCTQKTAVEVCDRIRQSCQQCGRSPLQLSIALGAVTKEDHDESVSDILKEAEDRMYRNKLLESKSTRSFIFLSLQKTLRERSHETEEHAQRLKETAVRIGRVLGLSDSKMDELSLLAALHDIGKIAIPDSILLKPSGLSAEEWQTVRRHPEIGYRIAASSPEMAPIAEAILSHHERWDGAGYPQGLKEGQIPLISRIIAVADAYDTMTHRSQYKDPIDGEAAAEEIRRNAGTQFDPEVVRAFLEVFADINQRPQPVAPA